MNGRKRAATADDVTELSASRLLEAPSQAFSRRQRKVHPIDYYNKGRTTSLSAVDEWKTEQQKVPFPSISSLYGVADCILTHLMGEEDQVTMKLKQEGFN
jgi:hypothetical protein